MNILKARCVPRTVLVAAGCSLIAVGSEVIAQPLVTGDLTIYYDFDSFTDVVMDGSGNGFNAKVQDGTRKTLDVGFDLMTSGVISNDTSNAKRGAGAVRFTQTAVLGEDPVFLDLDGGVIKQNAPAKVPQGAITVAAWLNLPEINLDIDPVGDNGDWNAPASILQAASAGPSFVAHYHAEGDGRIRLALRGEMQAQNIVNSSGAPFTGGHPWPNQPEVDMGEAPEPWPLNEWFHVAFTYDKNADGGAGEFAMYYNGTNIRSGPPNGTTTGEPTGPIDLGAWDLRAFNDFYDGLGIGAVMDNGRRRLHGLMDEFYIFTRALSEEEIGTLAMVSTPVTPGDHNGDGNVDAADYVTWRKDPAAFGGDPDGYNIWRANFGMTAGGGSALAGVAAIPEPASWMLAVVVVAGLAALKRNCRSVVCRARE
jgi:hypothetical protein